MITLVEKMKSLGLLRLKLIFGALIMAVAMIGFPISMFFILDTEALINPLVIGFIVFVMLCFGAVGYFCFVDRYILYRRLPSAQAETDGEFLYIHTIKEAKIPLADISEISVRFELPYIYQKEFLREFIIHLFSEEYGRVILEIPGYGVYKMHFVPHAKEASDKLFYFLEDQMNKS